MSITGQTQLYCLIGDPVSGSLSPFIMNRAFAALGIDAVYLARRVPSARLAQALEGLEALGVAGANVTHPHKERAVACLDHPAARVVALGATNTLHFTADGTHGYNTDATGTALALREFAGLDLQGQNLLVLGAGGAGRAAALGALEAGSAAVTFFVRDTAKAATATKRLRQHFPQANIALLPLRETSARDARQAAVSEARVIINATPIGMAHSPAAAREAMLIEDPTWLGPRQCCFDFVYGAGETGFLRMARQRGAVCLDGLTLLVAQARGAFQHWTGHEFDLGEMMRALDGHLRSTGPSLATGGAPPDELSPSCEQERPPRR